jgi:hypothetical protein
MSPTSSKLPPDIHRHWHVPRSFFRLYHQAQCGKLSHVSFRSIPALTRFMVAKQPGKYGYDEAHPDSEPSLAFPSDKIGSILQCYSLGYASASLRYNNEHMTLSQCQLYVHQKYLIQVQLYEADIYRRKHLHRLVPHQRSASQILRLTRTPKVSGFVLNTLSQRLGTG